MATDVARLSYDPARVYRGVVPQQGRVSLEAEQNEQRTIDSEERRKQLLDIVGTFGTPDDGYAVSVASGPHGRRDIQVGRGTMYVGGWRVELGHNVRDNEQDDWIECPSDPPAGDREHVVLVVQETDVTAEEDLALYEVALGGPDGAARTRLLQRIERLETYAGTCEQALQQDAAGWRRGGLELWPTMELRSASRLQVTWDGNQQAADACTPRIAGGFLGAENQLVRVQIARVTGKDTFDLLWGYDGASCLYRVSADVSANSVANPVLKLDRTPVDDHHRPRTGQAIQVLRATARLHGTDAKVESYAAALGGEVAVLSVAPYDPDTKTVQLPAPLPGAYTNPTENPQLYLRVWEQLVTGVKVGQAVPLTGTGMRVTITSAINEQLHPDDFWCIGVRPATPTCVYPQRYVDAPQPPDGPRQWACPLALVEWQRRSDGGTTQSAVLQDCRHHFRPLIELDKGGCCSLEVRPADAASGRLQELLNKVADRRHNSELSERLTVCFRPGRYELDRPIILDSRHSNIWLRGCGAGTVLAVSPRAGGFGMGMLVLAETDNVTISGFEFELPRAPALEAVGDDYTYKWHPDRAVDILRAKTSGVTDAYLRERDVAIGIRPINCSLLVIERCVFRFKVDEQPGSGPAGQASAARGLFGVGIFGGGLVQTLRVTNNRFMCDIVSEPLDDLVGYAQTPTLANLGRDASHPPLGDAQLAATLDDAEFSGNQFDGITAAALIAAQVGDLRIWDNLVKRNYAGFWIVDIPAAAKSDFLNMLGEEFAVDVASAGLLEPVLVRTLIRAILYPLPPVRDDGERNQEPEGNSPTPKLLSTYRQVGTHARKLDPKRASDFHNFLMKVLGLAKAGTPDVAETLATVWSGLAELNGYALEDEISGFIRLNRNQIECDMLYDWAGPDDKWTGPALCLLGQARHEENRGTCDVTGNFMKTHKSHLAVCVLGISVATVNSNTVIGRPGPDTALGVISIRYAAITGNVVKGRQNLRPNWVPLNTNY
jgi:hypothetical protein